MGKNIHILTPALDYERLSRPLNRGEPPVDRVRLYIPPADTHPFPEQASHRLKDWLEDRFDLPVEQEPLDPTPLSAATRTLYHDFSAELAKGHTLYINAATGYHQLGTAATTAASYLILDSESNPLLSDLENVRDNVIFYSTEPAQYYLDNFAEAAKQMHEATSPDRIATLKERADELESRVERDHKTVEQLADLLERDVTAIIDTVQGMSDDPEIEEVASAAKKLLDGLETTVEAMDELSRSNVWNNPSIESLVTNMVPGLAGVQDLMAEIRDSEEIDEPIDAVHLLQYFEERLDNIHTIVERVGDGPNSFIEEIERARPEPIVDGKTVFELIQERGVAGGVRDFQGVSYQRLPEPLEFNLRPTQRALLYTLSQEGPVNSVRQFTKLVLHHAVRNADATDVSLPDVPAITQLRKEPDPTDYPTTLLTSIQSTVQYNLGQLDEKGFVQRVTEGQKETKLKFRRAGEVYVETQEFDEVWLGEAFSDVVTSIKEAVE